MAANAPSQLHPNIREYHIDDGYRSSYASIPTMRPLLLCTFVSFTSVATAQLIVLPFRKTTTSPAQQRPLMMDPLGGPQSNPQGAVILSDVMGRDRSINIFAGFTRDIESVERRLDDSNQNSTVLAPLNSAIEKLPRKPWEDPQDYSTLGADAYEGDDGMDRAQRNLRRFVEAHIVPASPWAEKQKVKPIGSDRDIWWEEKDGKKMVCVCSPPLCTYGTDPSLRYSPETSRW